jgi:hypothetical protein
MPRLVGLPWTSDRPANTQRSQATDSHTASGNRTRNPNKRAATDRPATGFSRKYSQRIYFLTVN